MASNTLKNGPIQKPPAVSTLPEDADYALLQQPLNIGVKNVKQILNCVQSGSKEVKDIILNECNIVYECKVCQNLFRSLANFLYHKRCFCKKHICESMLLFEHFEEPEPEVIQVIEPGGDKQKEIEIINNVESKMDTVEIEGPPNLIPNVAEVAKPPESPDKNQQALEESSAVVEATMEISSKQGTSTLSNVNESNDNKTEEVPQKTVVSPIKIMGHLLKVTMKDRLIEGCKNIEIRTLRRKNEQNPAITFKPIEGNSQAVFQKLNIKEEISEVKPKDENKPKNFTSNEPIVNVEAQSIAPIASDSDSQLDIEIIKEIKSNGVSKNATSSTSNGPAKTDKKNKDIHLTRRKKLLNRTDCHVQSLKCLKCNTQFTTLRTLYFHMMSRHSQKRLYYPCPFCKTLFVQMYGVTRHLIAAHNKTKEQIDNKLRDAIRKSSIWKHIKENQTKDVKETISKDKGDEKNVKIAISPKPGTSSSNNISDSKIDDKTFHSYVKVDKVLTLHQCSKCARVFGRKSSQVSHQKFCIMNSPCKSEDGSEFSSSPPSSVEPYALLKPVLSGTARRLNFEDSKKAIRPKRGAEKQMHKDFVNSQTLKWRSANKIDTNIRVSHKIGSRKISHSFDRKIKAIVNVEKLSCIKCNRRFSSQSNLRRHAAIHIGWTRYECKSCKYQSYNKSDCWHHIERMHNIPESEIEKYIIHLVSDISKGKVNTTHNSSSSSSSSNNSAKKVSPRKDKKKDFASPKNKIINKKKRVRRKANPVSLSTSSPNNKERCVVKKEIIEQPLPETSKKTKKSKPVIIMKEPPIKKLQNNYKTVTTNSPTTIIISKDGQNSTMQALKNASSIAQMTSDDMSSVSPTKKFEVKYMTETMSMPQFDPRTNMHFPSRIFSTPSPTKTELITIGNGLPLSDKNSIKKNRNISDWLIRKEKPGNMQFNKVSPIKNESGPVIIGLVAAENSLLRNKGQITKLNQGKR